MANVVISGEDATSIVAVSAAVEGLGHRVVFVESSVDVVMEVIDHEAALVVIEERMANFDGYEVTALLRADPSVPDTLPIVILAEAAIDSRKLIESGATADFPKGGDSTRLADLVLELLGDQAGTGDADDSGPVKSLGL